ncbi:glycosyltransferase family 2 protein [Pseudoruegeria sp. HB172150]|uniref:glycosyltransferase family 2 protein n=1 Tax=Pseudoruegeria sp. HB172150 TaxID=2721164 RepID=UPI001556D5B9|nr:glycosyltransferase family 2 protein [Pseudoruegeria sp. HB172150]
METIKIERSQASSEAVAAPTVSIIIISYNTWEMTLECLESVARETTVPHEVIVLDNASSDGSAKAIAEKFPDVKLMPETANHGFAKGNNVAIEHARGKYVLLLNPDTVVLDSAIDKLLQFAQDRPDAKIWGGRTLYGDRSLNPTNCWRQMSLWSLTSQVFGLSSMFRNSGFFNPEGYGDWQRDDEREVDIVTGCLLLIERDFWHELGGFDLTYVMYGEEADLCLRARKLGARPRITPNAEIVHYVGASEAVHARKLVRVLTAKTTLIRQNFPAWKRPFGLTMMRLWPWSRMRAAQVRAWATRKTKHRESAESWGEVWDRRSEWRDGYPEPLPNKGHGV